MISLKEKVLHHTAYRNYWEMRQDIKKFMLSTSVNRTHLQIIVNVLCRIEYIFPEEWEVQIVDNTITIEI